MAFTLAHPAAVIPLRRLPFLALLPLIIGSMMPDLIGYLPLDIEFELAYSHSPIGSVLTDLPAGLILLALLMVFRHALVRPLWEPHRTLVANALQAFFARRDAWLVAVPSLLVGSWTHLLWDRFTHDTAWTYRHLPLLYQPLFPDGEHELQIYHVLQYATSVVGLLYLAWYYWQNLRSVPGGDDYIMASRRKRWWLVALIGVAVLAGLARLSTGDVQMLSIYARLSLFLRTTLLFFALMYCVYGVVIAARSTDQRS